MTLLTVLWVPCEAGDEPPWEAILWAPSFPGIHLGQSHCQQAYGNIQNGHIQLTGIHKVQKTVSLEPGS